jgi:hypothetical protein
MSAVVSQNWFPKAVSSQNVATSWSVRVPVALRRPPRHSTVAKFLLEPHRAASTPHSTGDELAAIELAMHARVMSVDDAREFRLALSNDAGRPRIAVRSLPPQTS